MKLLFIEARKKVKLDEGEISKSEEFKKLPENLHVLYTIQYKNLAEKIKEQLEKKDKKILEFQQVLGCSKIKPKAPLFLVGSGKFHALQLALSSKKETPFPFLVLQIITVGLFALLASSKALIKEKTSCPFTTIAFQLKEFIAFL